MLSGINLFLLYLKMDLGSEKECNMLGTLFQNIISDWKVSYYAAHLANELIYHLEIKLSQY